MIFRGGNYNTGWSGGMDLGSLIVRNWILSICAISIGLITICHSIGLVDYKRRYFVFQLIILFFYIMSFIAFINEKSFEMRPGLFLVLVSFILLILQFIKKRKEKINFNTSLRIF